ncbi:transcription initiation factor TFIID subunit 4B-like [Rattus rattus]|uniref:transcription initiation factor TFIID subunit 4B-like n=1 Tax=Rattus rattus TaxID=10117 RepID=UPI0013F398FA|nr:transcription initiation factor TFIID subunit 4B-like [Rattus rattus]
MLASLSDRNELSLFQIVQQPSVGNANHVTSISHSSPLSSQTCGQKAPVTAVMPTASIIKQISLPGNKLLSLQAQTTSIQNNKIKENGPACFRGEDDINDVTCMAEVNLDEENACILATHSDFVGKLIQSCKDEPFLLIGALQKRILDIGKKHDITELNSDAVNLISHATQERLRGLLEKLTAIAQHRMTIYKGSENYILSTDTRSQLKFLEKLDQLEKQRKDLEEREMLLKAAKSRSNKEDPEQLRLKQKAKELQQLELAQIQYRDANLTALAAIGPRKKRPLESGNEMQTHMVPVSRLSLYVTSFCSQSVSFSVPCLSVSGFEGFHCLAAYAFGVPSVYLQILVPTVHLEGGSKCPTPMPAWASPEPRARCALERP